MPLSPDLIEAQPLPVEYAAQINERITDKMPFPFDLEHSEYTFARILGEQGAESEVLEINLGETSLGISLLIEDTIPWVDQNVALLLAAREPSSSPEHPNPIYVFALRGNDNAPVETFTLRHVANIQGEEEGLVISPIDVEEQMISRYLLPKGSSGKLEIIFDGENPRLRSFNITQSQKV